MNLSLCAVKILSTSCEPLLCCQLLLLGVLAVPFSQSQDKHPIKGQAGCANDIFTVTYMSGAKQTTSSLSPIISSLWDTVPLSQNNGDGMARENCTATNSSFSLTSLLSEEDSSLSHPIFCDTSVRRWKPHLERISVREGEEACWRRVKAALGSSFCLAQGVVKGHYTHSRPPRVRGRSEGDKIYTERHTHTFTQTILNSLTLSHPEWGPTWN